MSVVDAIRALRAQVRRFAEAFDPALVSAADAQRIMEHAAAIEKSAAAVKAAAAARVAETDVWRGEGDKSAAHKLARKSGIGLGAARAALEAGKKMRELPEVAAAARSGELSPQQTAAIADAASADPSAERRLVEKAKRSSLGELRDECARTKAAKTNQDEQRRRIHAGRYLRRRTTPDGAGELYYRSTLDELAQIWAVVQGFADRAFRRARAEGRHENPDADAADGLLDMAHAAAAAAAAAAARSGAAGSAPDGRASSDTGSAPDDTDATPGADETADGTERGADRDAATDTGRAPEPGDEDGRGGLRLPPPAGSPTPGSAPDERLPVPATLIFRIDWDAFIRGWPTEGEVCEIAGVGPVPVSLVETMIATGDPFLAAVVTKGTDVVNVAHLGRRHTAHQRTALAWRDPMCVVEGCGATVGLERDHRHDWADTKVTLVSWSDMLCGHHHDLKTHQKWALLPGVGKRPMVPPDHPDHPGDRPPAPPPPDPTGDARASPATGHSPEHPRAGPPTGPGDEPDRGLPDDPDGGLPDDAPTHGARAGRPPGPTDTGRSPPATLFDTGDPTAA